MEWKSRVLDSIQSYLHTNPEAGVDLIADFVTNVIDEVHETLIEQDLPPPKKKTKRASYAVYCLVLDRTPKCRDEATSMINSVTASVMDNPRKIDCSVIPVTGQWNDVFKGTFDDDQRSEHHAFVINGPERLVTAGFTLEE